MPTDTPRTPLTGWGPVTHLHFHISSNSVGFDLDKANLWLGALNKKCLYPEQSSRDPRVCAQRARGARLNPDVKCER